MRCDYPSMRVVTNRDSYPLAFMGAEAIQVCNNVKLDVWACGVIQRSRFLRLAHLCDTGLLSCRLSGTASMPEGITANYTRCINCKGACIWLEAWHRAPQAQLLSSGQETLHCFVQSAFQCMHRVLLCGRAMSASLCTC